MAVQTIVGNPEKIKSLEEVDEVIGNIIAYKSERKCGDVGVLLIQNMQFGGLYKIKSRAEIAKYMGTNRKVDFGIKFYPLSYFVQLRNDLTAKLTWQ